MPLFSEFSNGTVIRAPGKLVLAGEYAVLDGCPSIVLAIDRGVECYVESGAGISTPMNDTRFVQDALSEASRHRHYRFQDWNPVLELSSNHKPGFGGSAAACVAACMAAGKTLDEAYQIHYTVQGSGSGIDVAASIHGGMFQFTRKQIIPLQPILPLVIWTGYSARTGPRVEQYLQWDEREEFVEQSKYWVQQFTKNPVASTRSLYTLLKRASQAAQFQYCTPEIEDICRLAEDHQGAAKPSGAGGGDCVVAFFHSEVDKNAFRNHCLEKYEIIDINLSPGVHKTTQCP